MRIFGLIGFPLEHSFSPRYFESKFRREGITDAEFHLFPLASIHEFPLLTETDKRIQGLAVTIPYKQEVIPFLDELDDNAKSIGAVNCIRIKNGKLTGFNTDWKGFFDSLQPLLKPQHKSALILGSGGGSKAVQFALNKAGLSFHVVSRYPSKGSLGYMDLNEQIMGAHKIIINCSPVGMYPRENQMPAIPFQFITPDHICYDLIYRPEETLFLKFAKEKGALIKNGMQMLELQAELNWKIWNQ